MKIVDFFKNIFNKKQSQGLLNKPKTKYQKYVESIDDLELCEMFINGITPELENVKEKYGVGDYPLQTKISVADSIEIAKKFFESIDINFAKKVNDIILGTNPDVILETKNADFAETTNPDEKPVKVRVPIRGDLRQLYEFVHECTHTFDIDNGWTETRLVLAEVAPQCMERLLDEYLLGMSEAELKK